MYCAVATTFGVHLAVVLGAGTASLHIGNVRVEDSEYIISVMLNASAQQAAAADFRLRYDPGAFAPDRVLPGDSARQADKSVTANVTTPGEYVIVVMGLNQNTIPDGELARVVLRATSASDSGESDLAVADATLATWEGIELPVNIHGARVRLRRQPAPDNDTGAREDALEIRTNDGDNKETVSAGVSGVNDNEPVHSGRTIIESTIAEAGSAESGMFPERRGEKQCRTLSGATLFAGLAAIVISLGALILRRRLLKLRVSPKKRMPKSSAKL